MPQLRQVFCFLVNSEGTMYRPIWLLVTTHTDIKKIEQPLVRLCSSVIKLKKKEKKKEKKKAQKQKAY